RLTGRIRAVEIGRSALGDGYLADDFGVGQMGANDEGRARLRRGRSRPYVWDGALSLEFSHARLGQTTRPVVERFLWQDADLSNVEAGFLAGLESVQLAPRGERKLPLRAIGAPLARLGQVE